MMIRTQCKTLMMVFGFRGGKTTGWIIHWFSNSFLLRLLLFLFLFASIPPVLALELASLDASLLLSFVYPADSLSVYLSTWLMLPGGGAGTTLDLVSICVTHNDRSNACHRRILGLGSDGIVLSIIFRVIIWYFAVLFASYERQWFMRSPLQSVNNVLQFGGLIRSAWQLMHSRHCLEREAPKRLDRV